MGYAATTIAMYGVILTNEQAKQLHAKLVEDGHFDKYNGYTFKTNLPEDKSNCHRFNIDMRGKGFDSRAENIEYFNGHDERKWDIYVFGVFLASNGYAYTEDIGEYIQGKTLETAKKLWDELCKEYVEESPSLQFVTQVW